MKKKFTKSKIKYQDPNDNTMGTIYMLEVYTFQKDKIKSFVSIKINEDKKH